jgi:hypothetical protein
MALVGYRKSSGLISPFAYSARSAGSTVDVRAAGPNVEERRRWIPERKRAKGGISAHFNNLSSLLCIR